MSLEIARVQPDAVEDFYRRNEREALRSFYGFAVVWHEQLHDLAAFEGEDLVGAASVRVAASLAQVERIVVQPEHRLHGEGNCDTGAAPCRFNLTSWAKYSGAAGMLSVSRRTNSSLDFASSA